jgi:predicted kinase
LQPRLLLFCGVPGSGKTTIATALSLKLSRAVLVQTDQVRAMLAHPRYTGAESRFVYGSAIATAGQALRFRYDTILDGTFPKEEFRREALSSLARFSVFQLVVYVTCDLATALRRNAARKEAVPEETIVRIYQNFDAPRNAVTLDTETLEAADAAAQVLSILEQQTL